MGIRSFSFRLTLFLLPLGILTLIIYSALFLEVNTSSQQILQHRLTKLEQSAGITTVFVGDSSLGNGLDELYFSELNGEAVLNLALDGSYGYAGSYNMARRAHQQLPDLENIVVVHTLGMMRRDISHAGYIQTLSRQIDPGSRDAWQALPDRFFNTLLSPGGLKAATVQRLNPSTKPIEFDYIQQGPPLMNQPERQLRTTYEAASIQPDKILYLERLATYCESHQLNCIYLHGPIWEEIPQNSAPYLTEINAQIEATSMTLIKEMVVLELNQLGDTIDHVGPSHKAEITQTYARLLASELE